MFIKETAITGIIIPPKWNKYIISASIYGFEIFLMDKSKISLSVYKNKNKENKPNLILESLLMELNIKTNEKKTTKAL